MKIAPLPHAAATWLDSDDEALFALANPSGLITLIKLSNLKGIVTSNPLKSASYLGRLWGNIGGMLSRGAVAEGADAAMSLVIESIKTERLSMSQFFQYSGDLNAGLVQYLNGLKMYRFTNIHVTSFVFHVT